MGGLAALTKSIPKGVPVRRAMADFALDYLLPEKIVTIGAESPYRWDPARWGKEVLGEDYTDDVKELMKSVQENTVTIARSANGTGKSHAAARIILHFYLHHPGAKVFTAAAPPLDNLKKILWGEIGSIIEKHPDIFKTELDPKNKHSKMLLDSMLIQRSSEEYVTGLTIPTTGSEKSREGKFSGKHAPFMLFVLDEADAIPEFVYRGIESCMSGGHVRLLMLFNPRQQTGPVYMREVEEAGNVVELTAFNHPNVKTGNDIFPGAVNREITVRRINKWSRPLASGEKPDSECFKVPNYLNGYVAKDDKNKPFPPLQTGWRKVTHQELYYMVLAKYPAVTEDQLISAAWIDAAVSRWMEYTTRHGEKLIPTLRPVMGLDVAEFGKDKNVLTVRYGSYIARQVLWEGVDPSITEEKAASYYWKYKAKWINVDANGVGAGIAPHLKKDHKVNAFGIKVQSSPVEDELSQEIRELGEFGIIRDQMLWAVREWLRTDPAAMLPPSDRLRQQMLSLTYQNKKGKLKITDTDTIKEKIGHSPDELMSLALTFAPQGMVTDKSLGVGNYIGK